MLKLPLSPRFVWTLAGLAALAQAIWAVTATVDKCITTDEIAHITAGQSYWRFEDFRLQPENGVLPQRLAALPTLLLRWRLPSLADWTWTQSDVWRIGNTAFYGLGNDTGWAILLARSAASLHLIALALLIFGWSWRRFGLAGGCTSLALFVFCPNFLAHGALATSDVAAAFWLLAATGAYWRFLHAASWQNALLSAVCLGLAAAAKFSAVLLAPICAALWLVRALNPEPLTLAGRKWSRSAARAAMLLAVLLGQALVALAVVWTCYGWHARAFNPALPGGEFFHPWPEVLRLLGAPAPLFAWLRESHLLPEAYTYGLAHTVAYSHARAAFFNGQVGIHGWVAFFPYAFLVKTPWPLFAALLVSAATVACWCRKKVRTAAGFGWADFAGGYALVPLAVLFAVYWAASLATHLNIGHRHLLPVYPPLFIVAGAAGSALWRRARPGRVLLAALLIWSAATAWAIRPDYLAYFNAFAGGPAQGYRHLVDSSLDWGQDLPGLARWLERNRRPGEIVHLAYFGLGNPPYQGIQAQTLPSLPHLEDSYPTLLHPGLYAISATMLQQPYSSVGAGWNAENEQTYQSLRGLETIARYWQDHAAERATLAREFFADPTAPRVWERYEELRFARLCQYLRRRKPDTNVGYSILIYRLDATELHAAIDGSLGELVRSIERAEAPASR
jgi:4-amino-4-deoxy-L-arabinose transferase-like glycosyltransferase